MSNKKDSRNRGFVEKAHLNSNRELYESEYDRIFGKKEPKTEEVTEEKSFREITEHYKNIHPYSEERTEADNYNHAYDCFFTDQDINLKLNPFKYAWDWQQINIVKLQASVAEWRRLAETSQDELVTLKSEKEESIKVIKNIIAELEYLEGNGCFVNLSQFKGDSFDHDVTENITKMITQLRGII